MANAGNNTVSQFAPGQTTVTNTLTGLDNPRALLFDRNGTLYVANSSGNTVSELRRGAFHPLPPSPG